MPADTETVLAAVASAMDRGAPLTAKALLKFDAGTVRRLFDAGELVRVNLRRGRAVETVIVVKAAEPTDDEKWTAEELDYLKIAYAGGVSFTAMEQKLKRSGGDILQQAWRLKLERGGRDRFGGEIPAWRIARLRALIEDARARGSNDLDGGADLEHRALRRAFAAGRSDALRGDRHYRDWSAADIERLKAMRAEGRTNAEIAEALRRRQAAVTSKINELGLGRDVRWSEDEDRIVVAAVERGMTIKAIAAIVPGRSVLAVKLRARILCGARGSAPWSDAETKALREAVTRGDNLVEFGRRIGRTKFAVRWRCHYLGLQGTHPKAVRPWEPHEDARIRAGWARKEKPVEIAEDLGRPLGGVYNRAFKLGIAGSSYRRRVTEADIAFIREKAVASWTVEEIAEALDRTVDAIYRQAWLHRISFDGNREERKARRIARRQLATKAAELAVA